MKPTLITLLLLSAVSASVAQRAEDKASQSPRDPAYGETRHSDMTPMPLASRSRPDEGMRTRYGAFGSVNFNRHNADFQTLPGIPNCCSRFSEGTGTGSTLGVLVDIPLSERVMVSLRGDVTNNAAQLQSPEHTVVFVDTAAVPALFTHTINAAPKTLNFLPMIGYRVAGNLWLHTGPEIGWMFSKRYDQEERLVEPSVGQFSNGSRSRNVFAGNIPKANPFQSSVLLGTSYELPLNRKGTMVAAPEFFYAFGLTQLVDGIDWKASGMRLGMALKYSPRGIQDAPPVPTTPPAGILAAGVSAVTLSEEGREIPLTSLNVEEVISTSMRPLLSYVFFDENSSLIPNRYNQITPQQAEVFTTESLYNLETMPTYYQVLNIIGRRLKGNPSATIEIVGCNSDIGIERENNELSERRARSVRDYLHQVWGIDEGRMAVRSRNLPENPSSSNDPDGIAENRRVEIRSSDPSVTEAIFTADTLRRATMPLVRFQPTVRAEAGVREWTLTALQNGQVVKSFRGSGEVPANLDWNVDADQTTTPRTGGYVEYQLDVEDNAGQKTSTPVGSIPIETTTSEVTNPERVAYKEVNRYSLIVFDFDRAQLNVNNLRLIDRLRSRISPSASVMVTGHTDRIGEAEYNLKLSQDRARKVASMLNASTTVVRGVGEANPPYDNNLPEGRYYNRTVDIVVETPVKR